MSGYVNRNNVSLNPFSTNGFISKSLRDLSRLGMKYDDSVLKNSKAVGISEKFKKRLSFNSSEEDIYSAFASLTTSETTLRDSNAFLDQSYAEKRREWQLLALNDEIDDALEILTDECIVYPDDNYVCTPLYTDQTIKNELKEEIIKSFKNIYYRFGFLDGRTMWEYFRKWLVDGYLAFEIIYDQDQKNIIRFKELDVTSLKPSIITDESGEFKKVYIQNAGQAGGETVLYDSNIIYISYSQMNYITRTSYIERLIRSYNLLRIMETTRIVWAVGNAPFRTKVVIPMGTQHKNKAQESLAKIMHTYKDNVNFDDSTGKILINGSPMIPFSKEIWLPARQGEQPEIESFGGDGPEISDTEALKYFVYKFRDATKIPYNRFDKENSAGYELAAEGMLRDEVRFSKFINRLRSKFSQILLKPLYIQMVLNHPELKDNEEFKQNLTLQYAKENIFEEMKEYELAQKRIDILSSLKDSLVTQDADMNDVHFFDINFLVRKILIENRLKITDEDLKENENEKMVTLIEYEGYKRSDAYEIFKGANRKKFTKIKKDDSMDTGDLGGEDTGMEDTGDMPEE